MLCLFSGSRGHDCKVLFKSGRIYLRKPLGEKIKEFRLTRDLQVLLDDIVLLASCQACRGLPTPPPFFESSEGECCNCSRQHACVCAPPALQRLWSSLVPGLADLRCKVCPGAPQGSHSRTMAAGGSSLVLSVFVSGPLLPPSSFLFCLVTVIKTLKTSEVVFIEKQPVSFLLDFHLQLGGGSCSRSVADR